MGAEGMLPDPDDMIVTTGGQQAIDLVCKTLVDPGDVVICEAPTYPGAVPVFCSYQADVDPGRVRRGRDAGRRARASCSTELRARRAAAEVHLLGADLPEPGRGDDVAASGAGAWSSWRASTSCWSSRTTPTACCATSGEPLPPLYQLDGGDYVIYLGTFSKILSPGIRLGWAVAPPPVMEKIVLGKQAADLCTSTLTQYFVREYFAEGRWRDYVDDLVEIYRGRRDAMLEALRRALPGARRPGPSPRAASSSGRRCPTTSTPATCWPRRCARRRLRPRPGRLRRRPRRATRCGSTSPASTRTRSARGSGGSAR